MVPTFRFTHDAVVELCEGDTRAIGGAITIALCGHWDHPGPCRWPHLTTVEASGRTLSVSVAYSCPDEERVEVESLIEGAIQSGVLTGPDGTTKWKPLRSSNSKDNG
jgi:hypothetical protein